MHSATLHRPRPRTLVHPGPFNPVRIRSMCSPRSRHIRLSLQPGLTLFEALVQPLAAIGIHHASTTILGGGFAQLDYCVAPVDPSRAAVVAYSQPIAVGRTWMVFGNATLGKGLDGMPLVHCHAAFRTEDGTLRGGHIVPSTARIGPAPIPVLVTSLEGFELRVAYDAETNIALLQPCKEARDA